MDLPGARRIMETTSFDVANQYLRFGWKLINQYAVPGTADSPPAINYVLGSFRTLSDTRKVVTLTDEAEVNAHLKAGWTLLDQYLTQSLESERRHEQVHFVLAWQHDDLEQIDPPTAGDSQAAYELDESTEEKI